MTVRANILRVVRDNGPGCPNAVVLDRTSSSKQLLFYHVNALVRDEFVVREVRDRIVTWTITEAGSKFLEEIENGSFDAAKMVSLENFRVEYGILEEGRIPVDWKKVEMKNWAQLIGRWGPVTVIRNPRTLVIVVPKLVGVNPWQLMCEAFQLCDRVADDLETRLGVSLGRGRVSDGGRGKAHFEISGDPVAEFIAGHMRVETGVGVAGDTSPPHRRGSMGIYDPRSVDSYLRTVTTLPQDLDEIRRNFRALSCEVKEGFAAISQILRDLPTSLRGAIAQGILLGLEQATVDRSPDPKTHMNS